MKIGRDTLRIEVRAKRAGYLYLLMAGTDDSHFFQLFPNALDSAHRILADTWVRLPRDGWAIRADGPAGTDQFLVMVTPSPRDFSAAGLAAMKPVSGFDPQRARAAYALHGPQAFAGAPLRCQEDTSSCARYGAARFAVREVD